MCPRSLFPIVQQNHDILVRPTIEHVQKSVFQHKVIEYPAQKISFDFVFLIDENKGLRSLCISLVEDLRLIILVFNCSKRFIWLLFTKSRNFIALSTKACFMVLVFPNLFPKQKLH